MQGINWLCCFDEGHKLLSPLCMPFPFIIYSYAHQRKQINPMTTLYKSLLEILLVQIHSSLSQNEGTVNSPSCPEFPLGTQGHSWACAQTNVTTGKKQTLGTWRKQRAAVFDTRITKNKNPTDLKSSYRLITKATFSSTHVNNSWI